MKLENNEARIHIQAAWLTASTIKYYLLYIGQIYI